MTTDNTERTRTEVCPCGVAPTSCCPWCDHPGQVDDALTVTTINPDGTVTIHSQWAQRHAHAHGPRTVGPIDPLTPAQRDVVCELIHQLGIHRTLPHEARAEAAAVKAAATAVAALLGITL